MVVANEELEVVVPKEEKSVVELRIRKRCLLIITPQLLLLNL